MSALRRAFGLGATFAAALNGTMVMPLIVMALTRVGGIDEGTATAVAAAELAGIAIYGLLLSGAARRARRLTASLGLLALCGGELASHALGGILALSLARLFTGLGEGALFGLICANVAGEPQAERIWGRVNLVGGLMMGLLLYGLSQFPAGTGRGPIFLVLATMAVAVAPAALRVRPRERAAAQSRSVRLPGADKALLWFIVTLAYGVQAGQWAVSGYLGEQVKLPAERVGEYLALSSILGFAGAVAPALARRASQRLGFVLLGFAVMAVSVLVFFNGRGDASFFLGQVGVNVGFYMLTPFIVGLLTENDADGSLVMRTLVIALFGSALGTAVAGAAFTEAGAGPFGVLCVTLIALCAAAAVLVMTRLGRRAAACASAVSLIPHTGDPS